MFVKVKKYYLNVDKIVEIELVKEKEANVLKIETDNSTVKKYIFTNRNEAINTLRKILFSKGLIK